MTAKIDTVVYGRKSINESDTTHVYSAATSEFGHTLTQRLLQTARSPPILPRLIMERCPTTRLALDSRSYCCMDYLLTKSSGTV
ncbi:hypothetical protein [Chroococcidiopsis sp. SAG 2025]|uniref:hypothetical protein n=1 Tax=Chroococcidiopsis sp. SAG 2025 TaxID=171389 RepID=UPI0029370942|nr:hypothetical protein [Chroococcidiopsis sp. SAG 2025]